MGIWELDAFGRILAVSWCRHSELDWKMIVQKSLDSVGGKVLSAKESIKPAKSVNKQVMFDSLGLV